MTTLNSSKIKVQPVNWFNYQKELTEIRTKVFIEEQSCPPDEEWDEYDRSSKHFIAYQDDIVLGCGRLMESGQIGRMAVYKHARGLGVGGAILATIVKYCAANNIENVMLNAQTHAIGFYQRYGFEATGDTFMEAGIPHQKMTLSN
ncbi:putative GNAT family N-acyltransferase [Sinobacterium caligoides]|uniref:Putative GNAT family N-acyltransferase n=1 Tax=Sinobacterium caligoides TaxID=933926 RepID=A0A3N2DZ60_9GAMM|nr:GNAT family N-acetyltransferase [Sinobacterium caligoides]ROS04575.1 putative GNAT family N-acyltransferase [Sinobacterium caligoides]